MSPLTLLLFFLFRFIHLPIPNHAQLIDCTSSAEYCWNCSSNGGNYSANSLYQRNLNNLLLSFPSVALAPNTIRFYNLSSPQVFNKVNVIALCRGDVDSTNCLSCLNTTSRMILDQCPNQMEAILWGERCMVRYSNRSIYQVLEEDPSRMLPSPNPVPDPEAFKNVLKPLLDKLINVTSSNERLYETGNAKVPNAKPIYALAQCTPDLTEKECKACLQDSSSRLPGCCAGVDGARILKPSCHLRFENGPFYSTTAPQQNGVCTDNAEYCWKCLASENDTSINMFMTNVKELLSSFSSDKTRSAYGFFNSSIGENSNKAYAIALCRGDLSPESCRSCVSSSSKNILDNCPNRWEAILWDELCMVRYSNNSIFSARNDEPRMYIPNPNNVWESNLFRLTLKPLLDKITSKASMGDSLKKYDSGQATVPGYETIYAAAQCTPDLDKDECYGCLDDAANFIPQQFDGKQGGRILKPSCNLRFEVKPFFSATADPVLSPNLSEGKNTTARIVAIAVVIPSVAVVIIIIMICTFLKLKKKPSENLKIEAEAEVEEDISWDDSLQFNLDTMMKATCDFSDENKLGEGGFGSVYKGRLSNGQYIAVKRLSKTSGQGQCGYMSPEYALRGQFSVKSDVYSFGVLLLEIVKGEKNSSFQNGEDMEDLLTYNH
uniref:Cysteine-rich receptor-like protein kinase n=1 Tax=Cannabis sativa TaxID=3483 RepID=A0A803NZ04_CANSA